MKKTFKRIVTGIMVIGIAAGIAACGGGSTAPTALPSSDTSGSSAVVALKIIDVGPIGTGPAAAKNVPIKVRYTGWLYDVKASNLHGTKFDSSEDRNITYDFILGIGQVIKGWDQGIEGMKRGGKRTLIIPSSLGYGVTGQGSIPSNAALVFDIELFDVDTSGSNGIVELKTTDILVGTGATAVKNNKVTVHYTGWLYDVKASDLRGTRIDSSIGKAPLAFTVGSPDLIKGFDQGVEGMKVGGKRTLIIPSTLGYGTAGQGLIPGYAALVFDVELVSVQ